MYYQNTLYVIEVNPRSSRTVPYISKVTNVPIVDLATKILLGETLESMDVSRLTAKKFLNIDSEEEGIFTVSCAGGVTAKSIIPVKRKEKEGNIYKLVISGLLGGHSGQMIDQERGNASILMGRLLYSISKDAKFRLVSLEGGQKDNAITKDCTAEIRVKDEYCAAIEKTAADFDKIVRHEFKTSDPGAEVSCVNEGVKKVSALDKESTSKVITLLVNHPQGVQRMCKEKVLYGN